jgi:uncharacterized iron-regulated membrane protein
MPTRIRTFLFWTHLTAGAVAGLVILTMSVTGVLLMYERQLIEWSDRGYRSVAPGGGGERLSVETLVARAAAQRPGEGATAITMRSDPDAPALVAFGQTNLYQDVYSGQLLGEPTTRVRAAMSELRLWHRYLALDGDSRPLGKAISGWSNLIFLFILVCGMYLWIPRVVNWRTVRAVALFRTGLPGKARDFNWHNVIGIWSAVPLAIVVATATPISFPWANALVYQIVGEDPPAPAGGARPAANAEPRGTARDGSRVERQAQRPVHIEGLNALWRRAEQQLHDWRSINLRLSSSASSPAVFAIDGGNGGQPQLRSTLTLDAVTGEVVRWEPFESQTRGRRLRSWSRFTHTGEYYGLVGQTIAGIVSAGAVVLVYTGLALALRRLAGWNSRRNSKVGSTAVKAEEAA